jgi:predicted NAD/FAD-dependent oxidoreductase
MPRNAAYDTPLPAPSRPYHIAIIGAGMAGTACARTLVQAGFRVSVFEQEAQAGGRMGHVDTANGSFDAGVQFFTVRDPRFAQALDVTVPGLCRPWSATTIVVLDETGKKVARPNGKEHHWVACPGMGDLVRTWAARWSAMACCTPAPRSRPWNATACTRTNGSCASQPG